ncbi:hypothetical protein QBC47DRAFT_187336 [Echria macrotheca]|uniref:Uncharacterized protein n=1 Tax=Echria macrotheca TaxID=438768 RepID=A0AAJ0BEH4_9PEZI|nr:hypothetical protein QBC47DRAFT_187336 [Echria macrotheca]
MPALARRLKRSSRRFRTISARQPVWERMDKTTQVSEERSKLTESQEESLRASLYTALTLATPASRLPDSTILDKKADTKMSGDLAGATTAPDFTTAMPTHGSAVHGDPGTLEPGPPERRRVPPPQYENTDDDSDGDYSSTTTTLVSPDMWTSLDLERGDRTTFGTHVPRSEAPERSIGWCCTAYLPPCIGLASLFFCLWLFEGPSVLISKMQSSL